MDFDNQSDNRDIISIIAIQLRNSDKIYFDSNLNYIFYNSVRYFRKSENSGTHINNF